jgi:DNA-binding transcriptional LysR family regulator
MPQTALYVEADYSAQMCADVASGALDLAIFYTPKPHADLHFETLGEIDYVMVSTEAGSNRRGSGRDLYLGEFRARHSRPRTPRFCLRYRSARCPVDRTPSFGGS